jgi:hypothetical protein
MRKRRSAGKIVAWFMVAVLIAGMLPLHVYATISTITVTPGTSAWSNTDVSVTVSTALTKSDNSNNTRVINVSKWAQGSYSATNSYWDNSGNAFQMTTADTGNTRNYSGSFTVNTEGSNTYIVYIKDLANMYEKVSSTFTVKIDKTAPTLTLSSSAGGYSMKLTASASDTGGSGVDTSSYKWASGSYDTINFPTIGITSGSTLTVATNGTYSCYAADIAGNITVKQINVSSLDSTPPTLTLTASVMTGGYALTASAVDNAGGKGVNTSSYKWAQGSYNVSNFPTTNITSGTTLAITSNGTYSCYVSDNASNAAVASITVSDIVQPALTYASDVFAEAYRNNGSVDTTIKVLLSGAKFINGTFLKGTHFTTANLPSGLNLVITKVSDTEVTLSLTGNAGSHELINSQKNIGITFTKDAFVNVSDVSIIAGNDKNDIKLIFTNRASLSYEAGPFTESESNDGSIAETKSVYLEGAKFRDSLNSSKDLVYGADYTISNISSIPQGLTLSAIRVSDHWVKLMLDGKATNHSARTISNIQINFLTHVFADQSSTVMNLTGNLQIKFIEKKPLRILEVYPSEISGTINSAVRTIKDTLGTNAQYEVTSITMNKFISLKEDINGKYDVVYFGKGRYFQNGVDDNKYGNDITNIAAQKVLEYINSNQLCIFNESAFKGDAVDGTNITGAIPTTIMYKKLYSSTGKDNVIIANDSWVSEANIKNTYANVKINKKPILTVNDYPVSYESMSQPYETRSIYMKYTVNDPDATGTTLSAILYVDRNNDSLFDPDEKVETQVVVNGGTNSIVFEMPEKLTGIFFWKLEVFDSKGAKDERIDVFRLKGENITVKVLQITPPNNNGDLVSLFNTSVTSGTAFDTIGYRYGEYNLIVTQATVDEFNSGTTKNLRNLNGNYDIVILGFHDNYSDDSDALKKVFNQDAIDQLKSFINTAQGVMFTHDTIHSQLNANLTTNFKVAVGQTNAYTAGLAGYTLTGYRWTVPFTTSQETTLNNNYAISNYQKTAPAKATSVRNVNSTAMTLYPFNLESTSATSSAIISVAATHFQWFKLDLEDPEVIPLFNLYTTDSGDRVNDDSMNNYYTYSKGNITYSGTGHSNSYPNSEVKLFVNTAMKAYGSANHAPSITLVDTKDTSKTNCAETTFRIKFKVFDFDKKDTKIKYEVVQDLDNDGTYENTVRSLTQADNNTVIEIPDVPNKKTPGNFSLMIKAQDLHGAAANPVVIALNSTQAPLINMQIDFFDNSTDPKIRIDTGCLVGQSIAVRTTMKVSGYADPTDYATPQFSLASSYTDDSSTSTTAIFTKYNLPQVTFSSLTPSPNSLMKEATIIANIGNSSKTTINFNGAIEYTVNGITYNDPIGDQISVRDGKVRIHVVDEFTKNIKNAMIYDETNTLVGVTDNEGWVRLNHIVGQKQYRIEAPTGYVYEGELISRDIHNANGDITGTEPSSKVHVTFDNYTWEVDFKVKTDLNVKFTYYQLKNDKSVLLLGDDSDDRELKVQKNAPVKVLVKVSTSPVAGSDLKHIYLKVKTQKGGVELTDVSPYYAAISTTAAIIADLSAISTESVLQLISTSSGITLSESAAIAVSGMQRVKAANDNEAENNNYNYADAAKDTNHDGLIDYYFVLEVPKALDQKISIVSMIFIMENGSYPEAPVNGVNVLTFTELSAPPLR